MTVKELRGILLRVPTSESRMQVLVDAPLGTGAHLCRIVEVAFASDVVCGKERTYLYIEVER